ncbi:unnamed protein product [Caenorhabditis auriculariae]|uniref:Uncharacterized protein n=1 Tax=Caenorhabditis auriculariae TaxID=2777116 RepID=A0A8S1H0H9_9PELO|nr:unnamed protein product [Caenorhabditis auriculariae]
MPPRPEVEENCFTPRSYQIELLDKACKKNVIVQLGTGSGKTFIAVLLLKEYAVQMVAPLSNGGKRSFFIVDKVNLVDQQAQHIERHTAFRVGRLHGSCNQNVWSDRKNFQDFLKTHHVIVITAQIFCDLISHAFLSFETVCVMIVDECHHVFGSKHAYRLIMNRYRELMDAGNSQLPRVLGLTASLIKDKTTPNELETHLSKLEKIMCCSIETASDLVSLSKYGAKPRECITACRDFNFSSRTTKFVQSVLHDAQRFFDTTNEINVHLDMDPRSKIRDGLRKPLDVLRQLGPWAAFKVCQLFEKNLGKTLKQEMLPDKTVKFLKLARTSLKTACRLLEQEICHIKNPEQLRPFVPHKFIRLYEMLKVFSPEFQKTHLGKETPEPLCAIVFVDQRYVAYALNVLLKQLRNWDPQMRYLSCDYVVGASGNAMASGDAEFYKKQGETLRRFHRGDLNLLVATNVLEEGVDVKQCNLVVKFDRPLEMRSYVQSRGRARRAGARYVVLVPEDDLEECSKDFKDFNLIEKLLLRRYQSVHNPVEEAVPDDVDNLVPPYVVPETKASVKLSNAIQLVNRYCSKLPSDIFTQLVPHNKIIPVQSEGRTTYLAELLLPINSPIKQSICLQTPMSTKKLAQMAVALEACRQLHRQGELDDNLLPKGRETIAKLMQEIDEEPDEYAPGLSAKVGSAKRKQLYDKKVARALNEALPQAGKPCYIYVFDMERVKEAAAFTNPKRRKFANPGDYDYLFGIVSSVLLPKVPPFPIFLRQGDMRVHLTLAPDQVVLDVETLENLTQFHDYIFTRVLQLCKIDLIFELCGSTPCNCLVVPLNRVLEGPNVKFNINMKYVQDVVCNRGKMPRIPDDEARRNFKFREENFKDAIVMPWYRNVDHPVFYYVAEVLHGMSPSSRFPDENYSSFNEYFIKKYAIEIYDQQQCLLDVDFTSVRLNLLHPRVTAMKKLAREAASASASPSDASVNENIPNPQRQILVPELMDVHPISATLWNLISSLPSVFYRLNNLLLADELRERILVNAFGKKIEEVKVEDDLEWGSLTYPATYEERQSLIVNQIQKMNKKTSFSYDNNDPIPENSFEIGVWDPSDAEKMGLTFTLRNENVPLDPDDEMIGLMPTGDLTTSGDLSDEEDDMHDLIMFDYKNQLENRVEVSPDFATPRADIEVCGWGDPIDEAADSPFQIIDMTQGQSTGVNFKALVEDVGRVFAPVTSQNDSGSTTVPPPPILLEQTKRNAEARKLLENESTEEREKSRRTEEVIDLDEFDEDDDAESEDFVKVEPASDDEFELLDKGEKRKKELDEAVVAAEAPHKTCGVSAPNPNCRFSFDKESPHSVAMQKRIGKTNMTVASEISHGSENLGYGVSPCLLLTALTTSNASDGISLERLETIGDSFLKYAVTDYLFHHHFDQHEGKLSFARSKEVSNCNLYRLGKKLGIPQLIVGAKFEPHETWLPPCYVPVGHFKAPNSADAEEKDREIEELLAGRQVEEKPTKATGWDEASKDIKSTTDGVETINFPKQHATAGPTEEISPLPYNLLTQQNISDKSIADAMEALIGAHLLALGPKFTLQVMKWMGLKVLTEKAAITSPLLRFLDTPEDPELSMSSRRISGITSKTRPFLVQAFTHASYYSNRVTGCYQRLEFLGDAVLDYMITRYLFEDTRQYSPGVLTDLRSALVNNTIFASLAVKYGFQKHFMAMCPGLHYMVEKFVKLCSERNFLEANFNSEMYMATTEEEIDEGQEEDVEVPKAMSDIFESIAGAIYLDSGRDLDVVWRVIYNLMKDTIEECCENPPRSPIRELMELQSSKARFSKLERIIETGKVRVTVDVGNNMRFTGMGRNYRIAKTTAAKRALRYLKTLEEQKRKANLVQEGV